MEINLILLCSRQSRLLEEALETKSKPGKGIRADFADRMIRFGSEISGLKIFADRIGPELEKNLIGSEARFEICWSDRTSSDFNIDWKNAYILKQSVIWRNWRLKGVVVADWAVFWRFYTWFIDELVEVVLKKLSERAEQA